MHRKSFRTLRQIGRARIGRGPMPNSWSTAAGRARPVSRENTASIPTSPAMRIKVVPTTLHVGGHWMETRLPKVRAYRKGMLDQHGVEIERSPPAGVEALLAKKVGESLSDDNTPERIRKMMQIRNSRGRRRQSRESTESISEMSNKRRGSKERKESAVADAMAVALQSSSLGSLLGASTSSSEAALAVAKPGGRSGSPGAGSAAAAIEEVLSRSGSPVMARVAVAEAGGTSAAAFPAAAKAKDREALAVGGKEASSFRRGSVADESTAAPRGGRAQRRSSTGRGSLADTDADSEPAPRPRRGKARNRSRHRTPTDCDGPPSVPRRLLLALPLIGPWYGAEPVGVAGEQGCG